jgi:hypothetical protein
MRFLFKARMDTDAANIHVREGTLGSTLQSILEDIEPEAAYFGAEHGRRTMYFVVDLESTSRIPAIAEPLFLALRADVEFQPVMLPEDLEEAGPAIEAAASRY